MQHVHELIGYGTSMLYIVFEKTSHQEYTPSLARELVWILSRKMIVMRTLVELQAPETRIELSSPH